MKFSIQGKLMLLGVGSVIITVIIMVVVGLWQTGISNQKFGLQTDQLIDNEIGQIGTDVINLVQAQDESIQKQISGGLNVLQAGIEREGGLSLSEDEVSWNATNQFTKEAEQIDLPKLLLGGQWIGQVVTPNMRVPVVDDLLEQLDIKATIFQVLPDGSGILRVATNVTNTEGKRAIGTYIPAQNPDGSPNAVVQAVLAGREYRGVAFVVDAWYVTAYSPVMDEDGQVIAVLFVGVKEENIATLRNAITATEVGRTGYVTVLGGTGDMQGVYIISKDSARDGENIWEETDADGNKYYQDMINAAVELESGEVAQFIYRAADETGAIREMNYHVAYYKPWDWVIVVNAFHDDYQSFYDELKQQQSTMTIIVSLAGIGLAIISLLVVFLLARRISRPIKSMTTIAEKLAEGNIQQEISYTSNDEIGGLATAFRQMIEYFRSMAKDANQIAEGDLSLSIQPRSDQDMLAISFKMMVENLRSTIASLQASAVQLDEASTQLTRGADQVNDATGQIAQTIQQVASGTTQQSESESRTAEAMDQLSRAVNSVAQGSQEQSGSINQVSEMTNQISEAIGQVTEHATTVQRDAEAAAASAKKGSQTVEETLNGMQRIQTKVGISAERVNELGRRSEQIGVIVETIDEIASQTNLLALNAAIEAARAGEQGKGFAVVAEEVRKLAERSSASTKEIGDLVRDIQRTVQAAVAAMKEGSSEVEVGVIQARKSGEALEEIIRSADAVYKRAEMAAETSQMIGMAAGELVNAMDRVSAVVEENTAATEEMTASSAEVSHAIENIASISQENSAAVEQVSASTEEVSAQVVEFRNSVQQLADMAQSLRELAQQFKL